MKPPLPEHALSMGRMIARTFSGDRGGDPALAAWSALLYAHLQEGRVFLDIARPFDGLEVAGAPPPDLSRGPAWLEEAAPGAAASGEKPLVLCGERLWFARYHDFDRRLRERLEARRGQPPPPLDEARLNHDLKRLFPEAGDSGQLLAAAHLVDKMFGLLTGGPGTGKTTLLARLMLLHMRQQGVGSTSPMLLLAPTGKAATRLRQNLVASPEGATAASAMDRLRASLRDAPDLFSLLEFLDPTRPDSRVRTLTIHRALGVRKVRQENGGPFRHDREHPLDASLVVIDEVSMVDLALMVRLVEAVPDDAPLILVGDAEQLKSVEAGPVLSGLASQRSPPGEDRLRQLAARGAWPTGKLESPNLVSAHHVHLSHNYRFGSDSAIGRLAGSIQLGDTEQAFSLLSGAVDADSAVTWLQLPDDPWKQHPRTRELLLDATAYGALRECLAWQPLDPRAAAVAFDRFRVLCVLRGGPDGADTWNTRLQRWVAGSTDFIAPRAVMVTANDPVSGLCNGDSGLVLPDAEGLPRFYAGDHVEWPAAMLPGHEPGWAITIHKSQGSEYDTVAVVLPRQGGERLMNRRLLYTAITRARKKLIILASESSLRRAMAD